jgi:hypothetical protein
MHIALNENQDAKKHRPCIAIFLDVILWCRLLAKKEIPMEELDEEACGIPVNGLPEEVSIVQHRHLTLFQVALISKIVGRNNIKMIRVSGLLAKECLVLTQVQDKSIPIETFKSKFERLEDLVAPDCMLYSTPHAAFYYRKFKQVFLVLSYIKR